MVVVARKFYKVRFRGHLEKISKEGLARINDGLGSRYRQASPEQRWKIIQVFLELNMVYLREPPMNFESPEDHEDWFTCFKLFLPKIFENYEPQRGHLHTYAIGWKHASLSRWLDERDTIPLPANQRLLLNKLGRKVHKAEQEGKGEGQALTEEEKRFYDSARFRMVPLDKPLSFDDGDPLASDCLVSKDPRDDFQSEFKHGIWVKIKELLEPDEFRVFYWKYDYGLTDRDIGVRLNITHQRVSQIRKRILKKVQGRLGKYLRQVRREA